MTKVLPFLVLFGLTGCAVDGAVASVDEAAARADGPTGESASAITTITLPPGSIAPQPLIPVLVSKLRPPRLVLPPPAGTCTNTQNRYTILTEECEAVPGAGGYWGARTVFASLEKAVCEMRWRPDMILSVAPPDLAALRAVAELEPSINGVSPPPPLLRPLCDTTAICNPSITSCTERARVASGPRLVLYGGMGGCSSCAFLAGDTVYAVLPSDYTSGLVTINLGLDSILVDPAGAQTFRIDVSGIPALRRTAGFADVYR